MPTITWKGDTTGLELNPTWKASKVRIHTVSNMLQPDNTKKDTIVLVMIFTSDQIQELVDDYGRENIPFNILGSVVIPLFPNAVLWTWNPPKGYERLTEKATYTAFEIKDDEKSETE